jgi:hypothetical protein
VLRVTSVVRYVATMARAIAAIFTGHTNVIDRVAFRRGAAAIRVGQASNAVTASRKTVFSTISRRALLVLTARYADITVSTLVAVGTADVFSTREVACRSAFAGL